MSTDNFVGNMINSVYGTAVRSGYHDKSLFDKKVKLADALVFMEQIEREIAAKQKSLQIMELGGIMIWSTIMITDIMHDALSLSGKTTPVLKVLEWARGKARKDLYKNIRYQDELKKIDQVDKALKFVSSKTGKGKAIINPLVDLYSNQLRNVLALKDHIDTQNELKESHRNMVLQCHKSFQQLAQAMRKIDAAIADDARTDDGSQQKRMSEITDRA